MGWISEVAALLVDSGIITIVAFISPFKTDRERARSTVGKQKFIEVYLDVPIEVCEKRDPKKLYQKARKGEIPEFTGISSDYELPENPEIILETSKLSVDECVGTVIVYLKGKQFIFKSG